jgi:hypothetical protein
MYRMPVGPPGAKTSAVALATPDLGGKSTELKAGMTAAGAEHDRSAWIERADRFSIPVEHKLLVVPAGEVGPMVRFGEWAG